MDEWLTESEAAEWLRVPVADLRQSVDRGEVPVLTIAGQARFSRSSLIAASGRPAARDRHLAEGRANLVDVADGHVAPPAGLTWLQALAPGAAFEHRWPARAEKGKGSGSSFEKYPKAWAGRVQVDGVEVDVKVGESTGAERTDGKPRLTVLFDDYPVAEFVPTVDGGGWASVIKPDGRHAIAVFETLPSIYAKAKTESYQQATGMTGSGRPIGAAVIIDGDDLASAVHHAAGRWLGKRGRTY